MPMSCLSSAHVAIILHATALSISLCLLDFDGDFHVGCCKRDRETGREGERDTAKEIIQKEIEGEKDKKAEGRKRRLFSLINVPLQIIRA